MLEVDDKRKVSYGIWYRNERQPRLSGLDSLLAKLRESDPYECGLDKAWWLAWWRTDTSFYDERFYLRMAESPDQLIAEHVDRLWQLFEKHRKALEDINKKLAVQRP